MSNAYDKKHQKFLGGGLKKLILDWKGYKIGFIGLIEKEWLRTLSTLPLEQVYFFFILFLVHFPLFFFFFI